MWYFKPWEPPITVDDPGEDGERITVNNLPANYFHGKGDGPRPAILMLGGSEGGLQEPHNKMARMLQAAGYSVFYPGYFRTSEANADFHMVPVETFDQSIDWLKARDDIDVENIGILGGSKGAEAALLVASTRPEIKAVVAHQPSNVVWQGFGWSDDPSKLKASFSKGGKSLPFLPYTMPPWYERFSSDLVGKIHMGSFKTYQDYPEAQIQIEKTEAPVLLICGEKDTLWPSCDMSRAAIERANSFGKTNVSLLAYPDAGHMLYGRPREETADNYDQLSMMGGSAKGNNEARKDSWTKIVSFFDEHLKSGLEEN